MSHSPEPWKIEEHGYLYVYDAKGDAVTTDDPELKNELREGDLRRIVACVNACRGIPTEVLGTESFYNMLGLVRALNPQKALTPSQPIGNNVGGDSLQR